MNFGERITFENDKAPREQAREGEEDGDTITELRDEQTTYSKALSKGSTDAARKGGDTDSRGGTAQSVPFNRQASSASKGDSELAKAVPVDDDNNGEIYNVPVTPVDPNQKPHRFYDNGAFLCCLSLMCCCVAIIILIVVIVVLATAEGDKTIRAPTVPPTPAPTSLRDLGVVEELSRALGPKVLEPNTPYSTALNWLLYEDPMQLDEYADNLVQRYVLILFYFQTSRQGPWVSCSPPENQNDVSAATCYYNDVERNEDQTLSYYPRNETSIRWLSGRHECEWAQIECFNDQVVTMDVYGQELTGTLPEDLMYLTRLATVSLSLNQFTGSIPSVYGSMESLVILELNDNLLTGIPMELWKHSGLLQFNVGYNPLNGTIPSEISQMTSLDSLFLFATDMNGTLPTELGTLDWSLRTLALYDNRFSGTIPTELFQLSLLEELNLSGNYGISGSLPSEVGSLKALKEFSMARTNMNGTAIPEQFWQLNKLNYIDIEESLFGGTISPNIGNLTRLLGMRASRNEFTGTIPTTIGLLSNLKLLWVHLNDLSGSVPLSVCNLRGPDSLQFLNADCGGSIPHVTCQCCTGCCDDAGICQKVSS